MKLSLLPGIIGLFLACALARTEAANTDAASTPLPEFSVRTLAGESVSHTSLAGKVVVANFWATWCADCRFALPEYVKLNEQFGGNEDFVFLAFSLDERPEDFVRTFAEKNGVNYRVVMGSDALADTFGGIEEIPTTFVFDRSGQLRFKQGVSIKYGDLKQLLSSLLEESTDAK